jgi:hypothetical protein
LRETKLLGTYPPQDIIEMSKAVYKVRISNFEFKKLGKFLPAGTEETLNI